MKDYRKIYWNSRMHRMNIPVEFTEKLGINKEESVLMELEMKKDYIIIRRPKNLKTA